MSDIQTARELGELTAEIRGLRDADAAVRGDIAALRKDVDRLAHDVQSLASDIKAIAAQIGKLEPSVNSLMTNRARVGYMIAGMSVIVAPVITVLATFWAQISEILVIFWRGSK
jgi:septal ring factor EnvC (AmiA/AmiB activator)